jgi:hypothetical protein
MQAQSSRLGEKRIEELSADDFGEPQQKKR